MIMGDYYLIPSNACGVSIISVLWSNVVAFTNIVTATNAPGVTNINGQLFEQTTVTYFTNFQYAVRAVECLSNSVALRQGMEKIRFIRRDFDSEFGQFFYPTNSSYTLNAVTNNQLRPQLFQRLVTTPDILISAADLVVSPANFAVSRTISRNTANVLPNLAGPGTVLPPVTFEFNKVGPLYVNSYSPFRPFNGLTELTQLYPDFNNFQWASFDGSTNLPVLYPSGSSLLALENQILMQINPSAPLVAGVVQLPNGTVGGSYALVFSGFTGSGGQPAYFWELSPNSVGGLPPGLVLNANGTLTGAPQAGTGGLTYDFLVRMTDAAARFVDRPYAITINP